MWLEASRVCVGLVGDLGSDSTHGPPSRRLGFARRPSIGIKLQRCTRATDGGSTFDIVGALKCPTIETHVPWRHVADEPVRSRSAPDLAIPEPSNTSTTDHLSPIR